VVFLVTEWGDDVRPMTEDEAMVIVNHQATGDVCTLMMCLQDKGTVSRVRFRPRYCSAQTLYLRFVAMKMFQILIRQQN